MKLRVPLVLVSALALGVVPTAAAKDLTNAEACGSSGCATLQRDDKGDGLIALRGPTGPTASAPERAAYYRLSFTFGPGFDAGPKQTLTTLYVPAANLVGAPGMSPGSVEWFPAPGGVIERVQAAISDLEPYSPPTTWSAALQTPPSVYLVPSSVTTTSEGRDWTPWLVAAAALILALGGVGFVARRIRPRVTLSTSGR